MLVLIYQDGRVRLHEAGRVVPHGRTCGRVIAIDHRTAEPSRQLVEQRALAYHARPVQDDDRLLLKAAFGNFGKTPFCQPVSVSRIPLRYS